MIVPITIDPSLLVSDPTLTLTLPPAWIFSSWFATLFALFTRIRLTSPSLSMLSNTPRSETRSDNVTAPPVMPPSSLKVGSFNRILPVSAVAISPATTKLPTEQIAMVGLAAPVIKPMSIDLSPRMAMSQYFFSPSIVVVSRQTVFGFM